MPRTAKKTEIIDLNDASIDQPKVAGALAALREQTQAGQLAAAQHESAVRAVAQRMGYALDSLDPDLIQRDIAANMRRSVESCLEVGRGLCVLKAACAHGEFMARLEQLGVEPRLAQRFMQSAVKFSNASAPTHLLKAAGTQSKLFELLVLDDEEVEAFELHGELAGVTLDDVARMSQKELRAALREARAEKAAAERLIEAKNKQIDKLQREVQRFEKLPPDEKLLALHKDAIDAMNDARGAVLGRMRQAVMALVNSGDDRQAHDMFLAGLVGQVQAELTALREEFSLPDVSSAAEQQLAAEVAEWSKA